MKKAATTTLGPGHVVAPLLTRTEEGQAGEEESELHFTDKDLKTPPPQPVLFKLFEEEPGGGWREAFAEPRPQERVLRHTAEADW